MQFFLCASCGFYIIFNLFFFFLPFGVLFARAWTARLWTLDTALLCYNPHARVRTFISVLPRTCAVPPSFSFSLTNNFSSISSHLTSNFHYQSINCLVPQYHPTISVLLLTPKRKVTAPVVSHVFFFRVIIALFVRPVARASLELSVSGNNRFSPSGRRAPRLCTTLPSSHPHTFSRNFHTYKHIHTQSSLAHPFSPHTPPALPSTANVKRKEKSALTPPLRSPRSAAVDTDHV